MIPTIAGKDIITMRHPSWLANGENWRKWRLTYRGGDDFIEEYVKKFSNLENVNDFKERKAVSPAPCFAKSVVNEIKNSIFQRMADVTRRGGPKSYQRACSGQDFGVDLHGSGMTTFLGREVVPELISMAKVGIFIDMPPVTGPSLYDAQGKTPYLYVYKAEEILSWSYRRDRIEEFQAVLLVDYVDSVDRVTGLQNGAWKRHRLCWIDEENKVQCIMFDVDGQQIDLEGNPTTDSYTIDLPYIPFITLELTDSLLSDVANHQIALANLESSDMAYTLKSNFPIYTEQVDDRDFSPHLKGPGMPGGPGTQAGANQSQTDPREIQVGNSVGRRYRTGLDRPEFINPSPEPVAISMAKQAKLQDDIRTLVNLSLSAIKPKMASAESKALDSQGLESGLSYIGLELERGERRIAKIWSDYLKDGEPATVKYPSNWSLQDDSDRRSEAKELVEIRSAVPSPTFQKHISQQIVETLFEGEVSTDELDQMISEIKNAEATSSDPEIIFNSVDKGILDLERAAKLLGFPATAPASAAQDHADKLSRILASQSKGGTGTNGAVNAGSRGVQQLSGDPNASKQEKAASRDNTQSGDTAPKVRGAGK